MKINDFPEKYQDQIRAQLKAGNSGRHAAVEKQGKKPALVGSGRLPESMVHSDRALHVRITRIGGRALDDDNLSGGCKELRDAIAAMLGRKGDSERDGFTWEYAQKNRG